MTKTPLTPEEQELLNQAVANHAPALTSVADDLIRGRILSGPEADALRLAIGDELASTGVDMETGAVDERGVRLDDLIDRVGRLSTLFDR